MFILAFVVHYYQLFLKCNFTTLMKSNLKFFSLQFVQIMNAPVDQFVECVVKLG